MIEFLSKIIVAPLIFVLSLAGYSLAPIQQAPVVENQTVGAALPSATAVFETSLASPITSSATTMTLTANSVRGGGALSGYACFTIDEGSAQAETVCGTVSGTTVSGMSRGISQSTGTTTVSALQFAHRRGANVKITDFPIIQILKAQNNGEDTFPNPLSYTAGVTPSNANHLTDKEYVDGVAFSGAGVIDATETARGVSELATALEQASSSVSGTSGPLVLQAQHATSTYNSATAGLKVVVTQNNGKIDEGFISTTTLFGSVPTFASTTIIGYQRALNIGKNAQKFTANGTFIVPDGVQKIHVRLAGGGGGGGALGGSGHNSGGGAGGYLEGWFNVSATTSIGILVGAGVTTGTGGTTHFSSFASTTGGVSGVSSGGTNIALGGVGGTYSATTSDSAVTLGVNGSQGGFASPATGVLTSGFGGSNPIGGGSYANTGAGNNGTGCGGGGSGGYNQGNSGTGADGCVIIEW